MIRSLALFIAGRYVSVGRRSQLVNFMSMLTVGGLTLSVCILLTVLSVMNGFDREMRENILGVLPHATVTGPETAGEQGWDGVRQQLRAHPSVLAFAPLVESTGVLDSDTANRGVLVNGVDPAREGEVSALERFMQEGGLDSLARERFNILLGETLAQELGVGMGDALSLYSLDVSINPLLPMPSQRLFTVSGIFRVGTQELDSGLALIALEDARALFRIRAPQTGLRLRSDDVLAVDSLAADLRLSLPPQFNLQTWTRTFGNMYQNIQLSRSIVGFLLWLLVAVAAFNLVVSLIMIVRDKRGDIAILRTLGATPRTIGRIFLLQGCMIGAIGCLLGVTAGIALSLTVSDLARWIESLTGSQLLSAEVYPVDFLPSQLRLLDIGLIGAGVFGLCLIASVYPAWRAARVQPARALRME